MDCIGDRTLVSLLGDQLRIAPDHLFLIYEDDSGNVAELTYRQFADHVARVSSGLKRLGIVPGEKVCVHLTNSPQYLIAWFALSAVRAVMVPSNVWNKGPEMAHLLTLSDAEWVITEPQFVPLFSDEVLPKRMRKLIVTDPRFGAPRDPIEGWTRFADLYDDPLDLFANPPRTDDLMEFMFTSGTTSLPKAVMLTQANGVWSAIESSKNYFITPGDRNMTSMPLFHVNAQGVALATISVGATLILLQRYSASQFMVQVRRHRATIVSMVPMLLRTVMAQPPSPEDRSHSLRFVKYAINVTDAEKQAFEERFGTQLVNAYGMSEAMVTITCVPLYGARNWPSVGLPTIGREVRVVDAEGKEVPRGQIGEIATLGSPGRTIMLGYYKDPEATARTIRDGWLHTGDLGYMDERGYLYFYGRDKDMIKRNGENVSALEVESVLMEHDNVQEVAVIGVADPLHDEAVKAFIVLRTPSSASSEDLIAFCRQRLAKFKVPSFIEFMSELPKTSIGKVEKKLLRRKEVGL